MSAPGHATRCEAVLFDFDGVVLDTETTLLDSWMRIFGERRVPVTFASYSQACFTAPPTPLEHRVEAALGDHDGDPVAIADEIRMMNLRLATALEPRPGLRELLADLGRRKILMGVVSNSSREWVMGHLRRLDLVSLFAVVLCGEEVARRKPEPDGYLAATAMLNVRPARTVAVEDTPAGIRAAKAAGLPCLAVPGPVTATLDLNEADKVANGFEDLSWTRIAALVDSRHRSAATAGDRRDADR